jgi:hypothetical protein
VPHGKELVDNNFHRLYTSGAPPSSDCPVSTGTPFSFTYVTDGIGVDNRHLIGVARIPWSSDYDAPPLCSVPSWSMDIRRGPAPAGHRLRELCSKTILRSPFLTAIEMVALPLRVQVVAKGDIRRRSEEWMDRLGLSGAAHQLVTALSGGPRQWLAIARTLAMASPLLFLDEPTSELDAVNRQLVLIWLAEAIQRVCILSWSVMILPSSRSVTRC